MISLVFEGNLQKMIDGEKPYISRPLIVGKPSVILIQCGADAEHSITITRRVIDKAMRHEVRDTNGKMIGNTGHGLTKKLIVSAIRELENPTMVFKGRKKGSILVITNTKDQKNRNIVIAIEFNRMEEFAMVNSIRSIYGRDNIGFFIGENIEGGGLLAANKEKADELLHSIGKSYPKENTFISFNWIIRVAI